MFDFVLAQAINNICNLKFSYSDILEYTEISDSLLRSYIVDKHVRELLIVSDDKFTLSSSIFSQYIVREGKMKNQMLEMLKKYIINVHFLMMRMESIINNVVI